MYPGGVVGIGGERLINGKFISLMGEYCRSARGKNTGIGPYHRTSIASGGKTQVESTLFLMKCSKRISDCALPRFNTGCGATGRRAFN